MTGLKDLTRKRMEIILHGMSYDYPLLADKDFVGCITVALTEEQNIPGDDEVELSVAKDNFRRSYLEMLLRYCKGNISKAAKVSGISRKHLYRLVDLEDINVDELRHNHDLEAHIVSSINTAVEGMESNSYKFNKRIMQDIIQAVPDSLPEFRDAEKSVERHYLKKAWDSCKGRIKEIARIAGRSERDIYKKVEEFGLKKKVA